MNKRKLDQTEIDRLSRADIEVDVSDLGIEFENDDYIDISIDWND